MAASVILIWCLLPGTQLIIDNPQKSDAIVVLAEGDQRYWRGLELLRAGYGRHLVLDAMTWVLYGQTRDHLARLFVSRTAGVNASEVSVCPMSADSTGDEANRVNECLLALDPKPRSVLLVTDQYHTRRALMTFRRRLPQYTWTAAAVSNDFQYGLPWWKRREWAKTYFIESEKLLWWELFDRWRN